MYRSMAFLALVSCLPALQAEVYYVDQKQGGPDVEGTLYWAVAEANGRPGLDYIEFIEPDAWCGDEFCDDYWDEYLLDHGTVEITDQVVIIGNPQHASAFDWIPEVSRSVVSPDPLFRIHSSNGSVISGLYLSNFEGAGIQIDSTSSDNWIVSNHILCESHYDLFAGQGLLIRGERNVVKYNFVGGCSRGVEIGDDYHASSANMPVRVGSNYIAGNSIGGTNYPRFPDLTRRGNYVGILIGAGLGYNWVVDNTLETNALGLQLSHPTASHNLISRNSFSGNSDGILLTNRASYNVIGGPAGGNWLYSDDYGINLRIGTDFPEAGTFGSAHYNWVQQNIIGGSAYSLTREFCGGSFCNDWVQKNGVGISVEGGSDAIEIRGNQIIINELHGVQVYNSGSVSVLENWIGMNSDGVGGSWEDGAGNGGYGVVAVNSGPIYISGNARGDNAMGFLYQAGSTVIEQ